MAAQYVLNVLQWWLAIGLLVWFFLGPWRELTIDATRQTLFELRDALFDMAADGRVAFDDPLYCRSRDTLNNVIRHTHHLSLGLMLLPDSAVSSSQRDESILDALRKHAEPRVGASMQRVLRVSLMVAAASAILRSPLALLAIIPLSPFVALFALLSGVSKIDLTVGKIERRIEADAMKENALQATG